MSVLLRPYNGDNGDINSAVVSRQASIFSQTQSEILPNEGAGHHMLSGETEREELDHALSAVAVLLPTTHSALNYLPDLDSKLEHSAFEFSSRTMRRSSRQDGEDHIDYTAGQDFVVT